MNIKNGELFRNTASGTDFVVKRIVRNMVVLESQDGERQVLTQVHTLTATPFYLRMRGKDL